MFRSKVFSERALALRARPEPLDARLQVTAPHEWVALAALGLALLALLLWSVFGAVERSVTVSAILVQSGERHVVTSPVSGHVVEVLAGVGDALADGQAIARVRLPEAQRQTRITGRLLAAVEESAERNAGGFQPALLSAIGEELRSVELAAAESIFASHEGTLVSHELAPGKQVRVGDTVARLRGSSDRPQGTWQALAFVPAEDAANLVAGMAAQVAVASPADAVTLDGQVLEVSSRPVNAPEWLAELGLSSAAPAHLLRIALDDPAGAKLADGWAGTARVKLGRRSLAALLLSANSI